MIESERGKKKTQPTRCKMSSVPSHGKSSNSGVLSCNNSTQVSSPRAMTSPIFLSMSEKAHARPICAQHPNSWVVALTNQKAFLEKMSSKIGRNQVTMCERERVIRWGTGPVHASKFQVMICLFWGNSNSHSPSTCNFQQLIQ